MTDTKPYKGRLRHATKVYKDGCPGLGYYYTCQFDGHPQFDGQWGRTSYVVKEEGSYIETNNSIYELC